MKEQIYTLTPTQNKRELIIKDNHIMDTKPYKINNKKEIITATDKRQKSKSYKQSKQYLEEVSNLN
jgi:hypothetical protein